MLDRIIDNVIISIKEANLNFRTPIIFNQMNEAEMLIIEEMTNKLGIPFINESAAKYTTKEYVGPHLEDLLVKLLYKANGNIKEAQKGVVVFNYIDTLYELNNAGISTILLKELPELIKGHTYEILYNGKKVKFDTTNVAVVGVGDFSKICREEMKSELSYKQGFKYIGGFQKIVDTNDLSLNNNDIKSLKKVNN